MRLLIICFLTVLPLLGIAQNVASSEVQIAQATMAAPEASREAARVLGYKPSGKLTVLRKGSNELICLARDPAKEGFSVACYHKDLEPFMARGRKLRADGKEYQEIFDIREEEVKSGKLKLPENTTLMVMTGKEDPATREVTDTYLRYVVYIPFATAQTTGLSDKPLAPGLPWLMDAGTHRAHIMVTPPRDK
ncbi:MAG: hypothetical protein AAGA85_25100 [Bacteroidota bacterium]